MNPVNIRNPFFYRSFLFIVLFELLSLFGYLLPQFNTVAFFLIIAFVLLLTLWKLEYGCYVLLAELFIGSKGFLFFLTIDGTMISLRIALWLVVMGVWCAHFFTKRDERDFWRYAIKNSSRNDPLRESRSSDSSPKGDGIGAGRNEAGPQTLTRIVFLFFLVFLFATLQGFFRNAPADVFFDMNGWLFFSLFFPFLSAFRAKEQIDNIFSVLFSAALYLSLKALALLFIYAHDPLGGVFLPLYRWVRTTGAGEITALTPTFARVFFQSQIYTLIAFFLLLTLPRQKNILDRITCSVLHITCFASLLLSLSRSFWLAGIVTLCVALLYSRRWKRLIEIAGIGVAGFVLIFVMMNFPYPNTGGGSLVRLIEDRATETQEAGIGSRWSLLPPLLNRISEHWLFGAGFGATVTYQSSDPRIVESSARRNNFYTTYAFEWGYLDLWLKFGFLGILVYGVLLWKIGHGLFQHFNIATFERRGLFFGFIALLITNIFSPYLNHPLGIGYLLVCLAFITVMDRVRGPREKSFSTE